MPEEFADWIPGDHLRTVDEIVEVVSVAVSCGVRTIRLTGGEPLLNPYVVDIVRRIAGLPDAPEVSMTTNGLHLAQLAKPLADAGLSRVNVSLDTLGRQRFLDITKRDRLSAVIEGIAAAGDAGLHPVKVNTILQRGVNDNEAVSLLRHALANGWRLRFIEQMPLDPGGLWSRSTMITADEIQRDLSRESSLTPVPTRGSMPAEEFYFDGGPDRRRHRQRRAALLRIMRPSATDRGRAAPQLPVRKPGDGHSSDAAGRIPHPGAAAQTDRGPVQGLGGRQSHRPRYQQPGLPPARSTDVGHRRLTAGERGQHVHL